MMNLPIFLRSSTMRNVVIAISHQLATTPPTAVTIDIPPLVSELICVVTTDWILPAFCLMMSSVCSILFSPSTRTMIFSIYGWKLNPWIPSRRYIVCALLTQLMTIAAVSVIYSMIIGMSVPMTMPPMRNMTIYTPMSVTHDGILCFSPISMRGFITIVMNPAITSTSMIEDIVQRV